MEKEQIVDYLDEKLAKIKKESPDAWSIIQSYENVITDVLNED